jgi:antitoxin PrlF
MKWTAKITSRGRVTIPREVRERLGVPAGNRLVFEMDNKGVPIIKARRR